MNSSKRSLGAIRGTAALFTLTAVWALAPAPIHAQEPNPTSAAPAAQGSNPITEQNGMFIYRVKVVQRNLDCVNYMHHSGSTTIGFEGTPLLPTAKGEARVNTGGNGVSIEAHFQGLSPANGFGKEYLTYVLWAISPDGRAQNLGEIIPSDGKANLKVTSAFSSFGMIVTAEPYFAVAEPSDVVVLQNIIRQDKTSGVLEKVNANYYLLPRGTYAQTNGAHTEMNPISHKDRSPLEFFEAENALRIAQQTGAEKDAPEIYQQAMQDLQNASALDSNPHGDRKMEITDAREAVERAEDARITSLRKQAAEQRAETIQQKEQAQADAQQAQLQAQQAQLQAEQAQAAQARADAARAQAEAQAAQAQASAAQAQAQAAEASKNAQSAEQTREKLRAQLNSVLQTSETARGLIVNLSDVLFDTGRYTLKPDTKIALAKVAGILLAYPGLKVQVEGYTDSVGGDEYNMKLSQNRADAVRDFLISQGVPPGNITSQGYGKADPVADNSTAAGRAQNRRVNMVVSGNAIGVETKPDQAAPASAPNGDSSQPAQPGATSQPNGSPGPQ